MRILLFGGSGQLGFEIIRSALDLNFDVKSPVASEVDIVSRKQVEAFVERIRPDVVINAAAYTAVDRAEEERDIAFEINVKGAENVALAAAATNARVFFLSTDYVFNGEASIPIDESTPPNPLNVYGESKVAGERATLAAHKSGALIVRTSALFGKKGTNFVSTLLTRLRDKEPIKIVNDRFMSPTYAGWLAEILLDLARIPCTGIIHATCKGEVSWYEFAQAISDEAKKIDPHFQAATILPISASEMLSLAKRPGYTVLSSAKLTQLLKRSPISWREGLSTYMQEVFA